MHLLIYDAQRGDPDFLAGDIRCVVTDGNLVNARDLSKDGERSCAGAWLCLAMQAARSLLAERRRQPSK